MELLHPVSRIGTRELVSVCTFHRKCLTLGIQRGVGVVFVIISLLCLNLAQAYNLDLDTVTIHSGESRSMFGYSVALHQDQGSKWLLIGAPRSQTRQPGVTRGGAVFRCPLDSELSCQEIPFDRKGNSIRHDGKLFRDVEDKSDQWFGASLYSSDSGIIVACAPRYVYFSPRFDKREPVGTCYVARSSFTDYEEYSPCRTRRKWGYHREGSCQAGFSVTVTEHGRQMLIGAVGSFYWQGQVFNFNFEDGPGRYRETEEGNSKDDYSYMGYSSAVGNFDNDDREDYVVGVPRGRQLRGKVVLYTQNLTLIHTIYGEQFGSYFGYSVAVTDVDDNGLDDVIIGAPLFSDYSTDNKYETGRVYIFYQNAKRRFSRRRKDILSGEHSRGRYGLSVAAIGDIDQDGYQDIAVGAPYGGENGRGVVYIYHGSVQGIITDIQQAVAADDVLPGAETFGWALAGAQDMDDNDYPDLLIGSQQSNRAMFLKSRPVVRVTPSLSVDPQNITLESEKKECILPDGTRVTCITVYSCIRYDGIGVPTSMDFDLTWKLDALKNDSSRVYLLHSITESEETKTVNVTRRTNDCYTTFAYLVNNVRDKLTPITIEFSFDIHDKSSRPRRDVTPILNQRGPRKARAEANFMKKCGPDQVCIPDLTVQAVHTIDFYTLGEKDKIKTLVMVENRGEDAYEAMVKLIFPPGASFVKITDKKYDIPIFCDPKTKNLSYVMCDLGNPLPANSKTSFTLISTPDGINGSEPQLMFRVEVNSSNPELPASLDNNVAVAPLEIQQAADLGIGGEVIPEQYIYTDEDLKDYRTEQHEGPTLGHLYKLYNNGASAANSSVLRIKWPSVALGRRMFDQLEVTASRPDISCIIFNETKVTKYRDRDGSGPLVIDEGTGTSKRHTYENQIRRHSRDAGEEPVSKRDVEKRSNKELLQIGCVKDQAGCTHIHCTVGFLKASAHVEIKVRARVITRAVIQKQRKVSNKDCMMDSIYQKFYGLLPEYGYTKVYTGTLQVLLNKLTAPFYFVSYASAEVLSMPYKNMKVAESTYAITVYDLSTYVNPEALHPTKKSIEAWIIGVAVAAGLLLLLLLIVLLWWCGFFRRKRPEEQAFLVAAPLNGDYKKTKTTGPDSYYT